MLVAIFGVAYGIQLAKEPDESGKVVLEGSPTTKKAKPTSTTTTAEQKREDQVKIAWVGDITPGSRYGVPPNDGAQQFAGVRKPLQSADVAIGNLEGTLGSGGSDKCGGAHSSTCFSFQAPASQVKGLKRAGFDVFNLANNHALDFGAGGQAQTVSTLDSAGIAHTGRPSESAIVTRNGVRVAILGFAPYSWASPLLNIPAASQQIREAASKADVVVAVIHAGAEGADQVHVPAGDEQAFGEDRGDSRAFARAAVAAGADLVVGSGPHVVRGLELVNGKVVAYSTGNFSGYNNFGSGGNLSLSGIVEVTLDKSGKTLSGRWYSVQLVGPGKPVLDSSHKSASLVSSVSAADFGSAAIRLTPSGAFRLP